MQLNCIKCSQPYQSVDEDPYYCPECEAEKKRIAAEVDQKMKGRRPKRPAESMLQRYDRLSKEKGAKFINVRDMGISF